MYYIYHIPGIKIGLSINPEQRVRKQGYNEYEILEEHNNVYSASDREIELQKQYGYSVDYNRYSKMNFRKNGIKGSQKWNDMVSKDKELRKKQLKQLKDANSKAVKTNTGKKLTDEQKQNISNGLKGKLIGSNNPATNLTEDIVRYIRANCKAGGKRGNSKGKYSYDDMAKKLNVTKNQIAKIVRRETWKHI